MPKPGDVLEATGVKLHLISIEPDLLEMEASYAGTGDLPPAHHHPHQDERFIVLEGRVRTIIAGEPRIYETGETFDVPAGTTHQMGGEGPARIHWEVRPALRTASSSNGPIAAIPARTSSKSSRTSSFSTEAIGGRGSGGCASAEAPRRREWNETGNSSGKRSSRVPRVALAGSIL
jgi:quercetin dioxygenase-like cupin family protein